MIKFLIYTSIHFLINIIFLKYNFLIDRINTSEHKKKIFTDIKTPLAGGFVFIIIYPFIDPSQNYILLFFLLSLYFLGLMSDINYISSPKVRIILQTIFILSFILISDLSIKSLSFQIFNEILNYKIANILFLLICLLVLVNGFNFLDGANTLVVGNFIICLLSIYYISDKNTLILDYKYIETLLILLSVIYIFNFFGKSFLGDSGVYTLSFLIGVIFINFAYDNYLSISPYFVACILWYPAIENLFSIIRRLTTNNKLSKADSSHLHHLLYTFIKNKFRSKKNLFINTLTGFVINIYLIFSAFFAIMYFNNTKILLIIIFINLVTFLSVYFILSRFQKK